MQELNEQQKLAVTTTEGYIRVTAGAGSGKTRIITNRYIYLVDNCDIMNKNILCITFTNNAAREMKKRIDKEIKDNGVGYICTFHSLALRALRQDIHCLGIVNNFTVMDTADQGQLFKKIYKNLKISNRDYHYADMRIAIEKIKNNNTSYIKCLGVNGGIFFSNPTTIEEKFFNEYIEEQSKNSMLDYFDLISTFEYILENFESKRKKWQKQFIYIMCDEFNDIDARQYNILKILSAYYKNLMIVGDPDQTIYSWRGSNIDYIINFDKEFHNVQDIIINTNYRSVPSILNVANSLIINNKNRLDKNLVPSRLAGDKVVYNSLLNPSSEAKWIVEQIEKLKNNGENLSDIAVLYRNNNMSRRIEEQLINKDIKYCIYNGIDFYSRKEIKDILSYLRFILYEKDIDFERIINVPKRGMGKITIDFLKEFAQYNKCTLYQALKYNIENGQLNKPEAVNFINLIEKLRQIYQEKSIIDIVNIIVGYTGYEAELDKQNEQERIENIEELKHSIIEFQNTDLEEKTLEEYLDKISLYTNNDKATKENAVKLMTIHSSKGLEFKNVFVCRVNEGILPSSKVKSADGIEEERRLLYVAITRAMDKLFITDVQKDFGNDNKSREAEPSKFLKELDQQEIEFANQNAKDRLSETIIYNSEDNNIEMKYQEGDIIEHSYFGRGIIRNVNDNEKSYIIKFDTSEEEKEIRASKNLIKIEQ